ncbi:MAG: D-alanyl-D-alanine carboxypeptidase/D-alanyl-D-alanine-endopeptidase [Deltaproteobacteria bacterium]|nr:D-alanyl-D-alanine carboxypeptidase/D-alanyl-D-alanine-endopeptidase [Deltaproteobacteria bacterium]
MTSRIFFTPGFYRFIIKRSNIHALRRAMTLLVLIYCPLAYAGAETLSAIINSYEKNAVTIGVAVHAVDDKKEIFAHNAHEALNPASTMKVLTSAVALTHLGGSYQYETVLSTDRFSQGVLQNLYLKGSGDPSLVEERLWRIAKDLKVRGVNKINGSIIIDNSYFDSFEFAGKEADSTRAYNASLSALAVNFNSFAVVATNDGAGNLEVHIDPPTPHLNLVSKIRPSGNAVTIARSYNGGVEFVTATGGVSTETIKYANSSDPVQYAGTTFKWVLNQLGIEFNGKIKSGSAAGNKRVFVDQSKPLSLILRDLNKFSNNFTAEMILKTIGAKKSGVPGSTAKGVAVMKNFLSGAGVDSDEYAIFNGSGLSKNNRISPHALDQVLVSVYSDNRIRADFIASLAIAGTDGTLRSRLESPGLHGNVKAKTGTLSDVTSLSGFIETASRQMLAFTIMVNGPGAGSGGFHAMQEKLLIDIYKSF